MALIVHVVDNEIKLILEEKDTTATTLASRFPFGDVYVRFNEPQGLQWRELQRGTRIDDKRSFYDMIFPINVDQLPEVVQIVHACTV